MRQLFFLDLRCWFQQWSYGKVLILSAHSDDVYIEQMTGLGAAGFLLKQTSSHILAAAIREVYKGNAFFSRAIAKRLQGREGERLHNPAGP